MTKPTPWTKAFETSCRKWQVTLGLTDWTLGFKVAPADGTHEATIEYNCENRQATMTSYVRVETPDAPERVALHEMLHLLFADMLAVTGTKGCDHVDTGRAEHCVIERLLNAVDGRP